MARRSPHRPLSAEEHELWRRTAKGFKPLDESRLKRLEDPAPPSSKSDLMRQSAPLKDGAGYRDPAPVKRTPVDRGSEKKIRRGRVEIEARIDLHGMTQKKARSQLLNFLRRAHENGCRQVLVITGKGAGARAIDQRRFEPWNPEDRALPGVLRRSFTQWMDDPAFASLVSGYAESHRRHGGSGAFYVMLRA
ncbi:Smr/MutS family protein [Maricaulaceae bacterium EIL42A08]|nr:Smr/MutS family protein [Maricaulaceae bacterium EIL42A08]